MRVKGVRKADFKRALVGAAGGCNLQHNGWPCGSCFSTLDLPHEYWTAVLAYRGDYDKEYREVKPDGSVVYRMATAIKFKADGTFSHHEFTEFTEAELQARIQKLAGRLTEGDI